MKQDGRDEGNISVVRSQPQRKVDKLKEKAVASYFSPVPWVMALGWNQPLILSRTEEPTADTVRAIYGCILGPLVRATRQCLGRLG